MFINDNFRYLVILNMFFFLKLVILNILYIVFEYLFDCLFCYDIIRKHKQLRFLINFGLIWY